MDWGKSQSHLYASGGTMHLTELQFDRWCFVAGWVLGMLEGFLICKMYGFRRNQ